MKRGSSFSFQPFATIKTLERARSRAFFHARFIGSYFCATNTHYSFKRMNLENMNSFIFKNFLIILRIVFLIVREFSLIFESRTQT